MKLSPLCSHCLINPALWNRPGTFAGQEDTVINEGASANSITLAASGSNAADGSSDVIAGLKCSTFCWSTGTNLWYPML